MHSLYQPALALIRSWDSIILQRHAMPDGDAVGAQTGMKELLRDNFPEKRLFAVGDSAARFDFLPDSQPEDVPDSLFPQSLCIILDCGGPALIADERWRTAGATLRFDHHLFQETIAQVDISDSSFESTCGLLTDFALSCGLALSPRSALPLYMGMVTDSGRFRFPSVTGDTLRLAAVLLDQGIDTESLFARLYLEDYHFFKYEAYVYEHMERTENGVAYLFVTRDMQERFGLSREAASNTIGLMDSIKGCLIWLAFIDNGDGSIRVRLRSRFTEVQPLAARYGGGGHDRASGATVHSWEEALKMVAEADAQLGEYKATHEGWL